MNYSAWMITFCEFEIEAVVRKSAIDDAPICAISHFFLNRVVVFVIFVLCDLKNFSWTILYSFFEQIPIDIPIEAVYAMECVILVGFQAQDEDKFP